MALADGVAVGNGDGSGLVGAGGVGVGSGENVATNGRKFKKGAITRLNPPPSSAMSKGEIVRENANATMIMILAVFLRMALSLRLIEQLDRLRRLPWGLVRCAFPPSCTDGAQRATENGQPTPQCNLYDPFLLPDRTLTDRTLIFLNREICSDFSSCRSTPLIRRCCTRIGPGSPGVPHSDRSGTCGNRTGDSPLE